ncbi:hypothetical protein CHRY9390_02185 [Chryseobacterium aquaeductus]|uniref:Lipoprotein n=1 Tax=Chryseobacterium aquaeductus TaxID=2675056 RepID=A0A9N8QV34_9FLAO|nr:hypothetical protein [Chryseobacterium aquaeductus]CAA7331483.1 hypothetical protein CHRY9390_02185 [Chryseobacterium potabilaquae]CAD7810473.1 hypothetical protein CHRY9390_02185 [Chryseobacterium aquaeductus]
MSTVKTNALRVLTSMFLLLIFFSCIEKASEKNNSSRDPEEIIFIGFSNVGGQMGNYNNIKITKDSIHFENGSTVSKKHREWHKLITSEIWKNLISSFKINDLPSIESSSSIQAIDGIDETFQIKTTKNSYVFVNAYQDVHYRQFEEFKTKLENIVPKKP